jgi:hypothetical protein
MEKVVVGSTLWQETLELEDENGQPVALLSLESIGKVQEVWYHKQGESLGQGVFQETTLLFFATWQDAEQAEQEISSSAQRILGSGESWSGSIQAHGLVVVVTYNC